MKFNMYDYVLQYGFDKKSQLQIQNIKDYLKENHILDIERKWLPHITIDLYDCANQNEFISKVDSIVSHITCFDLLCNNLNDVDDKGKQTLYIEPQNKEKLLELKSVFDEKLDTYRKPHRKEKNFYNPHITLCTNDCVDENLYHLTNDIFRPFIAKVRYIWIYNQNMEQIKEYKLEEK